MTCRPGRAVRAGVAAALLGLAAAGAADHPGPEAHADVLLAPDSLGRPPQLAAGPSGVDLFLSPDGGWGGWLQDGLASRGSVLASCGSKVRARTGTACWLAGA